MMKGEKKWDEVMKVINKVMGKVMKVIGKVMGKVIKSVLDLRKREEQVCETVGVNNNASKQRNGQNKAQKQANQTGKKQNTKSPSPRGRRSRWGPRARGNSGVMVQEHHDGWW